MFRAKNTNQCEENDEVDKKGAVSLTDSFVTSKTDFAQEIVLDTIQPEVKVPRQAKQCRIKIKKRNPVFETPFDEWAFKSSNQKDFKTIKNIIEARQSKN